MRTRSPKVAFLLALVLALVPVAGLAHPLGNFSINRFARLEVRADGLRVHYVIDMAEIPTFQAMPKLDADRDGTVSQAEGMAYLAATRDATLRGLTLRVEGRPVPLASVAGEESWALLPGQGGLQTLRLTFTFAASFTLRAPLAIEFADANDPGRLGWREIVAVAEPGASLRDSTVATTSQSDELRVYPTDMLSSPLDQRQASLLLVPGGSSHAASPAAPTPAGVDRSADRFAALISAEQLSPAVMLGALLLAMVLGAGHALTPGHGKTVVAAYLIGARGTARHALFLGLTVTLTHTAGVFALGLITLFASRYILPERVFPWIGLLSGLLVVAIGASLFVNRLRRARDHHHHHAHDHEHHHDHHHDHGPGHHHHHHIPGDDDRPITWRSLLALGVSGGLLPCPSALVVLLSAIALGRVGFGLLLIVAFSAGLAGVLTAIGLALVYASRLFARLPLDGRLPRLLPIASAALVTLAGLGISLEALRGIV